MNVMGTALLEIGASFRRHVRCQARRTKPSGLCTLLPAASLLASITACASMAAQTFPLPGSSKAAPVMMPAGLAYIPWTTCVPVQMWLPVQCLQRRRRLHAQASVFRGQ